MSWFFFYIIYGSVSYTHLDVYKRQVLDALSDAKETTRQRVIGLVERLAVRLDRVEADNRRLRDEKHHIQQKLEKVIIII